MPSPENPSAAASLVRDPEISALLAPDAGAALAMPEADSPANSRGDRATRRVRDALLLFSFDWDADGFARHADRYRLAHAGFDLFSFPSNARLLWYDIERDVERLARRYQGRLDGVLSAHEQFGALAAALLAERLGLPGTDPAAILACQHKLFCRGVIERVAPEANVRYRALPCELGGKPSGEIDYPAFVKPVKAAYSVLARRVDSPEDLARHIRFAPFERHIIERLVKPFDDICRRRLATVLDARHMLVEEVVEAPQFNLDGYVYRGKAHALGVVDELMYPGTKAFLRFAYPSRLAADVQARALDVAARVLDAVGFRHGFFNMEFFHDPRTGALKVIEFNPRLAAQLADLYAWVDGADVFAMSLALACGDDPAAVPRLAPRAGAAASFVFRWFGGPLPDARVDGRAQRWLRDTHPDATLMAFRKSGAGLRREMKWLGSYRYGVLNLHGADEMQLRAHYETVCRRLGWPAPY